MKREDAIQLLMPFVPSFQREFEDEYLYGKDGWMFRSDQRFPNNGIIPEKYLEGLKFKRDNRDFEIVSVNDFIRKFERIQMPEGRKISIDYNNYAGNPHLYGRIGISGVEMVCHDVKAHKVTSTMPNSDEIKANPNLQDARYKWEIEPCRILSQEEIDKYPHMWDMFYAGCRTNRFTDVKELIATAIIICLKVIQGPFFLIFGEHYEFREEDCFLIVSADGDVQLKPLTLKRFNINNQE